MKSNILKANHKALIKANKAMTPQERLMAFYRHSRLLSKLARAGQKLRKRPAKVSHAVLPPHF